MKNILPSSIREEFDKKDILCCEYLDLTEIQEREIFQRVQLGIPLTAAEKVRATTGVWQEFAQLFEQDFPRVVARTCIARVRCPEAERFSDNEQARIWFPSNTTMLFPDIRNSGSNLCRRRSPSQTL